MNFQSLNGQWQLRNKKDNAWITASVPGCVELDLMNAGLIPDPFVDANEEKVQWIFDEEWEYQITFSVNDNLLAHEKIILRCEGIDTVANILLNGELIGSSENMFRVYEFDVTETILPENNTLSLSFPPLSQHLAAQYERRFIDDTSKMGIEGGHYMRKAPCHFGWDWGPKLPPIGIWKDIELVGRSEAKIDDIHLHQNHQNDGSVQLLAEISVEHWGINELSLTMSITNPDGQTIEAEHNLSQHNQIVQSISSPQLWYPAGYGDQPLYQINFQLKTGQTTLDTRMYQVGLRTIELRQEDDEWGKSFTFIVNGIPVFAKGANWIPADSFPTRISRERLERWISDAVQANHNMLRVWGGGIYETEDFYDLCDKYGVLVWQDFTFACKIYPMDEEEYLKNVQQEVNDNVRRIRHRASLALWCGNNEMEWGWEAWVWDTDENATLKSGYDIFFHHLLPKWLQGLDPDTPYWPSSPSSNTPFKQTNSNNSGDAHYWSVWHGGQPFLGIS
jgi:beta-mannosidase